jgi:hypothetical protein
MPYLATTAASFPASVWPSESTDRGSSGAGLPVSPKQLADTPSLGVEFANLAGALAMLGWGSARRGCSARLFGAAEALRGRAGLEIRFTPWLEPHERLDTDTLAAAWAEGRAPGADRAVAEAPEESE